MVYDGAPSRTLPALVTAIRQELDAGMRCMYMNSPTMVAGVRSMLYAAGTDVAHEVSRGALVLSADHERPRVACDALHQRDAHAAEPALRGGAFP
jgi:hypothetical protein